VDSVGAGISKFAAELGRIDLEITDAHTFEDKAEGLELCFQLARALVLAVARYSSRTIPNISFCFGGKFCGKLTVSFAVKWR